MSLQDARKEAKRLLSLTEIPQLTSPPVRTLVTLFLETRSRQNKAATKVETERLLIRHFLPTLGSRPISEIKTQHINTIVDKLMETPGTATHAFAAIRTFLNWAVARRYITHSPLAGVPLPAKPGERDRVLSDAELAAVYREALKIGYQFGVIILICIHTGMRRGEVAGLKWTYITPEFITLPGEATKNGQQHVIPNLVGDILKQIPKRSDYIFPSNADTPFSAWSKNKKRIDKACGVEDWVVHDLRRTFSTKIAEWQLAPPHVIERLLNHVTGTMSPIARVYNRATYAAEMKIALEQYELRLHQVLAQHSP